MWILSVVRGNPTWDGEMGKKSNYIHTKLKLAPIWLNFKLKINAIFFLFFFSPHPIRHGRYSSGGEKIAIEGGKRENCEYHFKSSLSQHHDVTWWQKRPCCLSHFVLQFQEPSISGGSVINRLKGDKAGWEELLWRCGLLSFFLFHLY